MDELITLLEFDASTGIETVRELTADELQEREAQATQDQAQKAEQEAKADARASALAKLADLGLTAEEIAAL